MSLARKPIYAAHLVVTVPYLVDRLGRLRPQRPSRCTAPLAGVECVIVWHGERVRKCGPAYPLAMARCRTHGIAFTLYPPGWLPFGRRIVLAVAPSGLIIDDPGPGLDAWSETCFGATVEASQCLVWPASSGGARAWQMRHGHAPYGVRRTQLRHIAGANTLFGLSSALTSERPTVVAATGLNMSDIVQAAGRVRDGPLLVTEGMKGADILRALGPPNRRLLPGFVRLGIDREYWGRHLRQHHQTKDVGVVGARRP